MLKGYGKLLQCSVIPGDLFVYNLFTPNFRSCFIVSLPNSAFKALRLFSHHFFKPDEVWLLLFRSIRPLEGNQSRIRTNRSKVWPKLRLESLTISVGQPLFIPILHCLSKRTASVLPNAWSSSLRSHFCSFRVTWLKVCLPHEACAWRSFWTEKLISYVGLHTLSMFASDHLRTLLFAFTVLRF